MTSDSLRGVYVTIDSPNSLLVSQDENDFFGQTFAASAYLSMNVGTVNFHSFGNFTSPARFVGEVQYVVGWPCVSDNDCSDGDDTTEDICSSTQCSYQRSVPTSQPSASLCGMEFVKLKILRLGPLVAMIALLPSWHLHNLLDLHFSIPHIMGNFLE